MSKYKSKYKGYPTYKGSGVEWIGEVPEHWEVKPAYAVAIVRNGYPFKSELFKREGVESDRLIRIRDIAGDDESIFTKEVCPDSATISNGDVLIGMDGDFNVHRWRRGPAKLNQRMCAASGRTEAITQFLSRCLPTPLRVINDLAYATTVKHLSSYEILHTRIAVPPTHELTNINVVLDRETTRIDALITKKTRFIELLKEKRSALITHAVTKGLDPNVKMKDSGVEWIGEVPEGWETLRIKRAATLRNERRNDSPDGWTYVGLEDVEPEFGRYAPTNGESRQLKDSMVGVFRAGDVLYGKLRPYLRKAIIAERDGVCSTEFLVLHAGRATASWLHRWLLTPDVTQQVEAGCDGAKMPRADWEHVGSIPIPLPPLTEQSTIAEFLDRETIRIDALVVKVQRSIDLLKEHRSALITAAVTGKIDVRDAA